MGRLSTPLAAAATLAALLWGAAAPAAEDLDATIARTLAAYGGEALPAKGTMVETAGRVFSRRQGVEGQITRRIAWPGRMAIEIAFPDGTTERRVLDGDRGWRDGVPAPEPLVRAMQLQAARLALPMLLVWEREAIDDLGTARLGDGTEVRRLRIGLGAGTALFVEIAAGSGQILRSAGVMQMAGAEMSFGASYSGITMRDGIGWPALEHQSAMGQDIGWTRIETIRHGGQPDADSFRP